VRPLRGHRKCRMTVNLFVAIDGTHVLLVDCDWVLWRRCGCPQGVTVGGFPDGSVMTATEDAAWSHLYDTAKEIAAAKDRGERVELVTRERCRAEVLNRFSVRCEHGQVTA
jgi:hypothetical protein